MAWFKLFLIKVKKKVVAGQEQREIGIMRVNEKTISVLVSRMC